MNLRAPYSDQLENWSVNVRRHRYQCLATTAEEAARTAPAIGFHFARIAHRALQTLRQCQLSLPERSGARPQILPLGQLSKVAAKDGLRARGLSGEGARIYQALRRRPGDPQGDLRHQQRTLAPARNILAGFNHDPSSHRERPTGIRRCQSGGSHRGENAKGLAAGPTPASRPRPRRKTS